jgi:hypothetical protein
MTRMRWIFALIISSLVFVPVAGAAPRLLAWWPMFEGQGQIVHDLSGNGNNGVLGSTTAVEASDPTWFHGGVLNSLRFNGGQFVTVPDSPALEPQAMTVLALARGSSSPGQWRYIVSKGALSCQTGSYGLYSGFGGGAAFYVSDGSNFFVSPEAPPTVWDGKWHVFAGSFDGTTVRFYVDGTQVGTGTTVPLPFSIGYGLPTNDGAQIGSYVNGCNLSFKGDIDEVSIWNAALPITTIWQKVIGLFISGLH